MSNRIFVSSIHSVISSGLRLLGTAPTNSLVPKQALPEPGKLRLMIQPGIRVLLVSEALNNLTRRIEYKLTKYKTICRTEILNQPEPMVQIVDDFKPDIIICPYLKMYVPNSIFEVFTRPCLIIHPGIPGDQGASALDWAILKGRERWGVTVLDATEVFDGGDIWSTEFFAVPKHATKSSLYNGEVADAAARCAVDAVSRFCQNVTHFSKIEGKNLLHGSFQRNMKNADRKINWQDSAEEIVAKIRMSDTVPGAIGELLLPLSGQDTKFLQTFRLYDGHTDDGSQSEVIKELIAGSSPGDILATRHKSILVRAGDYSAVWIGQMKKMRLSKALKLTSTRQLSPYMVRSLPVINSPCRHDSVQISITDGVCTVIFDFYNGAMDTEQAELLRNALRDVAKMDHVTLIALVGGERFFSTGIHLCVIEDSSSKETEAYRNITAIDDVVKEIASITSKTTVAVLRGNAGAGGAMLACACDLILAHPGVVVTPTYRSMNLYGSEYWTYFLPRKVGSKMANQLTSGTESLVASAANDIGLVDLVLGRSKTEFYELYPAFLQNVKRSKVSERIIHQKMAERTDDWFRNLEQHREQELVRMKKDFQSSDFHEAMRKFVYKL